MEIKNIIDKYLHFATITKIEDAKLRSSGLNHKMPDVFYDSDSVLYGDTFARYKNIGYLNCLACGSWHNNLINIKVNVT